MFMASVNSMLGGGGGQPIPLDGSLLIGDDNDVRPDDHVEMKSTGSVRVSNGLNIYFKVETQRKVNESLEIKVKLESESCHAGKTGTYTRITYI